MGWPLRARAKLPRVRRLVHLPDGRGHGHDRHGRRARLPRRRAVRPRPAPGAEDAQARAQDPRRRASGSPGARRRFPRAASTRCRRSCTPRASSSAATARASSTCPALKGIHYAVESGILAAEAIVRALQPGEASAGRARSRRTTRRFATSFVWKDLKRVRNMRQAFGEGLLVGGARAGAMTVSRGHVPRKRAEDGAATPSRS